jgi:uncharacterized protein YhbP (UPF0306 family)
MIRAFARQRPDSASQNQTSPSPEELRILASELIKEQSTMALATAKEYVAWAAPVYFAFHKPSFYFFSDPESRHIQESMESGQASATIYAFAFTWKEIRGIQMTGKIQHVPIGLETVQAIRAYLKKFPFTKEFFKPGQDVDMASFEKRFRVKLYKFSPTLVYYLDNQIRFGFREEIILA